MFNLSKKIKSTYSKRLREHYNSCLVPVNSESEDDVCVTPTTILNPDDTPRCPPKKRASHIEPRGSIAHFFGRCSEKRANEIKKQVMKFVLQTGCSLDSIEHKSFKKLLEMLCPEFCKHTYSKDDLFNEAMPALYEDIMETNKLSLGSKCCLRMLLDKSETLLVLAGTEVFIGVFSCKNKDDFAEAFNISVSNFSNL